ncbi:hypothetical protein [Maricaulis sp.]|uniref:hypothetical protein n=1 Tax=Maricaulis sp. TaxID=1486257 RepID=UPI002B2747E1|nr:hypothetical protein [Maricaulis sp.]
MNLVLLTFCLVCGFAEGPDLDAPVDQSADRAVMIDPGHPTDPLDTLEFEGTIRARGLIGLMRVSGTLGFANGDLVWTAQGETDRGPYVVRARDGRVAFMADYTLPSGEPVRWTGFFDGARLMDVEVVWSRRRGDLVHDLMLPVEVTLDFTPEH